MATKKVTSSKNIRVTHTPRSKLHVEGGVDKNATQAENRFDRTMFMGSIIDSHAYLHCYQVRTPFGGDIVATPLGVGSQGVIGVRDFNSYPVGSKVAVWKPDGLTYGLILGAVPRGVTDTCYNVSDWLTMASRCGLQDDQVHRINIDNPVILPNFNQSRPYDAYPGDVGWINSLGMGLHIGLMSIMLRGSDTSGLWFFYLNNLTRLAAYNYQFWSALTDTHIFHDQGENNQVTRLNPYPWEVTGMHSQIDFTKTRKDFDGYTETGGDPTWKANQEDGVYEPQKEDQQGIPRLTELKGYIADLDKTIVSVPDLTKTTPETYSSKSTYDGLSEDSRYSNGMRVIRSTKGILLEKSVFIPVPKQIAPPDSPNGDTAEEGKYKYAGQFGEGEAHSNKEFEQTADFVQSRMGQLFDEIAWITHKQGMQALYRHEKDWYISKEKDTQAYKQTNVSVDTNAFSPTNKKFLADMPKYANIKIDHREDSTHKYYKSRSLVYLMDDGSVIIEDGWGSQRIMRQGNIEETCSGDMIFRPGRNFTVMAPRDINLKAGNAFDITASKGDGRIKTDRNLHTLSGNSGIGGTLIESRGIGYDQEFSQKYGTDVISNGIILLSKEGQVNILASSIYQRSIDGGKIVLDADSGKSNVELYAQVFNKLLESSEITAYGVTPETVSASATTEIHQANSVVFGQTQSFIVNSSAAAFNGGAITVDGAIYARAMSAISDFTPITGLAQIQFQNGLSKTKLDTDRALHQAATAVASAPSQGSAAPYKDGGVGTESFINSVGFSCRLDDTNSNQYGLEDFVIYASRWQQYYDKNNSTVKWDEPVVYSPGKVKATMPFPGYNTWTKEGTFVIVKQTYWTPEDGEAYGLVAYDAERQENISKSLKEGYLINTQV